MENLSIRQLSRMLMVCLMLFGSVRVFAASDIGELFDAVGTKDHISEYLPGVLVTLTGPAPDAMAQLKVRN